MNKHKHTPGPWTENACEVQAPDGTSICEIFSRPNDSGINYPYSPEADANSRLICAAPDLLAALESAVEWLQTGKIDGVGFDEQSIIADTCEAIAKAKGATA
tara:strand:+ start:365 stop:670 length:306 start_codon:yes stop_codon:yes gene_type:complete